MITILTAYPKLNFPNSCNTLYSVLNTSEATHHHSLTVEGLCVCSRTTDAEEIKFPKNENGDCITPHACPKRKYF